MGSRTSRIRSLAIALAALAVVITFTGPPAHAQTQTAMDPGPSQEEMARRWAPIHYQDVDVTGHHALSGRSDYITRVDFDGDLVGRNNWENAGAPNADLSAHAYYSVVETSTHWFITYMFFHPRDWVDHPFDAEHENDAEGALLSIERDGSTYGVLRSAITVAHLDFFSYVPDGSTWTSGVEDVDGTLQFETSPHDGQLHPVTAQEAKGHGLKARPDYDIDGGDGIVYYPSTVAEVPRHANDRNVTYNLVNIAAANGLWVQRANADLFAGFGTFAGDDAENPNGDTCGDGTSQCSIDAANAPWGWDDHDDIPGRGEIATDPAKLVAEYFTIPEGLSRDYTSNLYQ
jgi:hypothetical protein